MKQRDTGWRRAGRCMGWGVLMALPGWVLAAPVSSTYQVTTTILQGSCEVDLPVADITLPDVERGELENGSILGATPVTVTVSGCGGLADVNSRPYLTVAGNTVSANAPGKYLFSEGGPGSAPGYGIILSQEELHLWSASDLIAPGDTILLSNNGGRYAGGDKELYVGVGCGEGSDCMTPDHAPGDITAKMTFTFSYK